MSFRAFSCLFFTMLGLALMLLTGSAVVAKYASNSDKNLKKHVAVAAMVSVAGAFAVNTACGVRHKKLWARGGPTTKEEEGPGWFAYHVGGNLVLVALALWAAVKIWTEAVPVFP